MRSEKVTLNLGDPLAAPFGECFLRPWITEPFAGMTNAGGRRGDGCFEPHKSGTLVGCPLVLLATWKLNRDHEVVRNDAERSRLVAGK